jgi:hypothetical protein
MEVLFDARGPLSSYAVENLVNGSIAVIAAVVGVMLYRKPSVLDDVLPRVLRNSVVVGVALLILAGVSQPFLLAWKTRFDFDSGRVVAVEGCAHGYRRVVHVENHSIADTDIAVARRAFHFNSSVWSLGYRDADDAVHDGQRLKAYTVGDRLVRLELLQSTCPAA